MTTAPGGTVCANCQAPSLARHAFCGNCGTPLGQPQAVTSLPPVPPEVPAYQRATSPASGIAVAAQRSADERETALERLARSEGSWQSRTYQGHPGPYPQGNPPSLAWPILLGFIGAWIAHVKARNRGFTDTSRYWIAALVATLASAALSIALYAALFAVLASSLSGSSEGSGAAAPYVAPTTTSAVTDEIQSGSLGTTWTIDESGDGGYSFVATLSAGPPQHLTNGLGLDGLVAGSACQVDSQTDAVIPAELTVRNNTSSFATQVAARMSLNDMTDSRVASATPTARSAGTVRTAGSECSPPTR